jgi:hypothetical protein
VTVGNDANLSAERALTAGTGISITDGGANSSITVAVNQAASFTWTGDHTYNTGTVTFQTGAVATGGWSFYSGGTVNISTPVKLDMGTSEIHFQTGHTGITITANAAGGVSTHTIANGASALNITYSKTGTAPATGVVNVVGSDFTCDHSVQVTLDVVARQMQANGDSGGQAAMNTLTATSDLTANSTGVGTILFKGATSRNSTGFIKFYVGLTAYYVPVFSAITG